METPFVNEGFIVSFAAASAGAPIERQSGYINPTSFRETVDAEYAKRQVLGLSHSVAQYVRTNSRKIQMEIWMSAHILARKGLAAIPVTGPEADSILDLRDFFESLLVPCGRGMAPPIVEVDWPGASLHFVGVLESLNTEYERFGFNGVPIEYKMDLSFLEVATDLMISSEVRNKGLGYMSYVTDPRAPTPRYKPKKSKPGGRKPATADNTHVLIGSGFAGIVNYTAAAAPYLESFQQGQAAAQKAQAELKSQHPILSGLHRILEGK